MKTSSFLIKSDTAHGAVRIVGTRAEMRRARPRARAKVPIPLFSPNFVRNFQSKARETRGKVFYLFAAFSIEITGSRSSCLMSNGVTPIAATVAADPSIAATKLSE